MKLETVGSTREYEKFYKTLYLRDENFKDNKTSLLPLVCSPNSPFRKNSWQEMLRVSQDGKTLCQCVLIVHKNSPHLLNIAFFESLPHCDGAVNLMLERARIEAEERGAHKIIAGMDGHLNYGFGFSLLNESPPSFGEGYNPPYYDRYFDRAGYASVGLLTFRDHIGPVCRRINEDFEKNFRLSPSFEIEPASISRPNIRRYTDLSNAIFEGHRGYFRREYDEDWELFRAMAPVLEKDNLIFIKDGGTDVGYVFWYPDYNELVSPGGRFGSAGALRYILGKRPKTIKMVEMGVLSPYQSRGLVMLAFKAAMDAVEVRFKEATTIMSSWILSDNLASVNFARRYTKTAYKEFIIYEKDV